MSLHRKCCCASDCCAAPKSVTSLTRSGLVATAVCPGHNFADGATVTIAGATPSGYNGAHAISVTDNDAFTFSTGFLATPATGTITATISNCTLSNCGGCTPETVRVSTQSIALRSGCYSCPASGRSYLLTGTFPDQGFCLGRIGACTWRKIIENYTDLVVGAYFGSTCSGSPICQTDTLIVSANIQLISTVTRPIVGISLHSDECDTSGTGEIIPAASLFSFNVNDANEFCDGPVTLDNDHDNTSDPCEPGGYTFGYDGSVTVSPCCTIEEEDI